jgi:quercetin dioxygenase-like cupin family protein
MSHRCIRKFFAAAAALSIGVLAAQRSSAQQAPAQQPPPAAPVLEPTVRFEQDVALPAKRPAKPSHVLLSNWAIHGTGKIQRFPEGGFMVVQLHNGAVTVTINGKAEQHKAGDFWTVPAGAAMSVEVTSESAVLQTLAIR